MKFEPSDIAEIAHATRFDPASVEKSLHLKQLLLELNRHVMLRGKLVLKGGTALNVFHHCLPRLSVDIDLNYIGQAEREAMLKGPGFRGSSSRSAKAWATRYSLGRKNTR